MSALDGLRALELTQVMVGPFCGQLLADMDDLVREVYGSAEFRAMVERFLSR